MLTTPQVSELREFDRKLLTHMTEQQRSKLVELGEKLERMQSQADVLNQIVFWLKSRLIHRGYECDVEACDREFNSGSV